MALDDGPPLTGVVVSKDAGDRIGRCLQSLAQVCPELLVLGFSTGEAAGQ